MPIFHEKIDEVAVFLSEICIFPIKSDIKILKDALMCMTSQMTIWFTGTFYSGHELGNPNDTIGYLLTNEIRALRVMLSNNRWNYTT